MIPNPSQPIGLLKITNPNQSMTSTIQLLKKLESRIDQMDYKLTALLVREEPATKSELKAIREGKKEFDQGKFVTWKNLRTRINSKLH